MTAVRAERGHAASLARGAAGIPAAPPRVVVEAPGRAGRSGRVRVPAGGRRGDHGRAGPGSSAGLEINPLIITAEGNILALDAKMDIDSNAVFRHPDIQEMRDLDEEDPQEIDASRYGLNYIHLDGNVGNMVNGAGLAMATMDIVKFAGASPANFLDVGGSASEEAIENGFRIITTDPRVKGILINVFGGILRCDVLAHGVVNAARKLNLSVPVVVRMEGTNSAEGRKILSESGLKLTPAKDLNDAAEKVAAMVK